MYLRKKIIPLVGSFFRPGRRLCVLTGHGQTYIVKKSEEDMGDAVLRAEM